MNAYDRMDQSAAEDGQRSVSISLMDSFAAASFERAKSALKQLSSELEIIAWNTSAVDTTDMQAQVTDLMSDLDAMKTTFDESL